MRGRGSVSTYSWAYNPTFVGSNLYKASKETKYIGSMCILGTGMRFYVGNYIMGPA